MRARFRTAIMPIASFGKSFLPGTKSIPREILNAVDPDLIEDALYEAPSTSIMDFILITTEGKSHVRFSFDIKANLDITLRRVGKGVLLVALKESNIDIVCVPFERQREALGVGHAIWPARRLISRISFAVVPLDDLIVSVRFCSAQMMEAEAACGGSVIVTIEVLMDRMSADRMLDVREVLAPILRPRMIAENLAQGSVPSSIAIVGRYMFNHNITRHLNVLITDGSGEVELTNVIAAELPWNPDVLIGYCFAEIGYLCGSKFRELPRSVALVIAHRHLNEEFGEVLESVQLIRPSKASSVASVHVTAE